MAAPSSGKVTVPSGRVIKIPVSRIPAGTMPVMTSSAGGTQILLNHSGHLSLAPSGHSGGHIVTIQKDSLLSSPARLAAEGQRISQAILSTTPGSQIRSAMITTTTPTTNVRAISSANVTPNSPAPPYTPQSIKQMNESSSRQREVLVTTSRPSSEMKKLTSDHKTMPLPSTVDRNKGLRHFSTKVCDKVKEKGATTYNEVADELVAEYFESSLHRTTTQEQQLYDQKNIRRRVYDALNVLMAMNIIAKEKKEIKWIGLPSNSAQECFTLEAEKRQRQERIKQKMEQLQDMIVQQVAFKNLVERNRENEKQNGKPSPNTLLYLPYIVINTEKKTVIDCSISYDKTEYLFNFDQPFEIHDDFEVLKRMGLSCGLDSGQTLPEEIPRLKQFLPPALRDYVDQIADGQLQFEDRPKAATQPQSQVGAMIVDTTQIVRTNHDFSSRTPAGSSNGTQRNDLSSPPDAADMEVALTLRAVNTAGQQLAAKQSGLTDPQSSESQQQWFENQQPSTHK